MSKIDEKLVNFTNDVMSDVSNEKRQIIDSIDKELAQRYDAAELDYLTKAYDIIQESLIAIDQEKNERLSKTIMDNKIKLLNRRRELINTMYLNAKTKLREYTKTEAYLPHLYDLIAEAKEELGDGELVVNLNATDAAIVETVKEKLGLEVTLESEKVDFIGGCKVYNRTRNVVSDYTFNRKLEDQREEFISKCHLDVE